MILDLIRQLRESIAILASERAKLNQVQLLLRKGSENQRILRQEVLRKAGASRIK
jgi:hypothetical protein